MSLSPPASRTQRRPSELHSHDGHGARGSKATASQGELGPIETKATLRPFPAPGVSYRRRRQELVKGILAEEFREFCRSHPELTEEQALSAFVEAVKDQPPALHEEMVSHGSSDAVLDDCNRRAPHRHVELYVAFPIGEHVRRSFERWLESHPSISEEDAAAHLLERGLEAEHADAKRSRQRAVRRSTGCQWRMAKLRSLLAQS